MRIAVCDDEKAMRDALASQAKQCFPDAEIASFASGAAMMAPDRACMSDLAS